MSDSPDGSDTGTDAGTETGGANVGGSGGGNGDADGYENGYEGAEFDADLDDTDVDALGDSAPGDESALPGEAPEEAGAEGEFTAPSDDDGPPAEGGRPRQWGTVEFPETTGEGA